MGRDLKGNTLERGFTQCKNGRYKYSFRLESGKQTAVYGASVAECKKNFKAALAEYNADITTSSKSITFTAYYNEWIENLAESGNVKQSTIARYKLHYKNHLKPAFGTSKMASIKAPMVKKFQRDLKEKGLKARTINNITVIAHHIFEDARRDEIIVKNPFDVLETVPTETNKDGEAIKRDNNRALSREEQTLFLNAMKGSRYYNATRLLFATGMRCGEMRGLKWSDYDKKNGVLHIRRTASVDANGKPCTNSPKSKHGRRDIPLNEEITTIIDQHKEETRKTRGNIIPMDEFMFLSAKGEMINLSVLAQTFKNVCCSIKKNGHPDFKDISPHCARHTFISQMLLAGKNLYAIKALVGHSPTTEITESVYFECSQDAMNAAMQNWKAI